MKTSITTLTLGLLLAAPLAAQPTDDGLYAVFETNQGSFSIRLHHEQVPMTVANFVGLAEGTQAWLDKTTDQVRREPFYNGVTFHRVIEGFMIQSGSRNGEGTDGPGYRFPDEPRPELTHAEGVLSMANSGIDTNGSQFFITVAETPWLNYRHTVFGTVIDGFDNVVNISKVDTEENNRPVEPVVIESLEILRIGEAAAAFDAAASGFQEIGLAKAGLHRENDSMLVTFPRQTGGLYTLLQSMDLNGWERLDLVSNGNPGETAAFDITETAASLTRGFYQVEEISNNRFPEVIFPETLVNKTLDLDVVSDGFRIVLRPDDVRTEENQGDWLGTGDIFENTDINLDYFWQNFLSRGQILFLLDGYVQFDLDLKFLDEDSGTFTGVARTQPESNVHGLFTLQPRD